MITPLVIHAWTPYDSSLLCGKRASQSTPLHLSKRQFCAYFSNMLRTIVRLRYPCSWICSSCESTRLTATGWSVDVERKKVWTLQTRPRDSQSNQKRTELPSNGSRALHGDKQKQLLQRSGGSVAGAPTARDVLCLAVQRSNLRYTMIISVCR